MTFRSIDVGDVLDMMIHDIDVLLMLVGREPDEVHASAVGVLGDAEDVCNARLVFHARGDAPACVANVTASRLALKTERKIRIIGESLYVSADFVARSGTVVRKNANAAKLDELRRRIGQGDDLSGLNFLELVTIDPLVVGDGEPLRLQLDDFLKAVRTGQRPQVDAEAGFAAVRTAERIVAEARRAGSKRV
jgi:predicted dehydrogenase